MNGLSESELAAFVAASMKALDLPVAPDGFAGVVANMSVLLGHATRVMAFDIPVVAETAPDAGP